MTLANLDLDLEVFQGPFDLLLTLVLKEEVDLLEVDLAEVVLAYVEHLERTGELDLEAATEFLVLIAAVLELKSRLMLPVEDDETPDLEPGGGRRRAAGADARVPAATKPPRRTCASAWRPRTATATARRRCRRSCGASRSRSPTAAYEPEQLGEALGGLLRIPPPIDLRHVRRPAVSVEQRLHHLRELLSSRRGFSFDDAVKGVDRLTEAVTLFALLELYKAGEAQWEQAETFGPITVRAVERSTT